MQKDHIDVTSLPFVTPGTGGKRHCFWTPVPSIGNDCANEKRGEELGSVDNHRAAMIAATRLRFAA